MRGAHLESQSSCFLHQLSGAQRQRIALARAPTVEPKALPRAEYVSLRDALGLKPGSRVHLRPRRVTRFGDGNAVALA